MSKESELLLDLEEVEKLKDVAQRDRLQNLLLAEKFKLQNEIKALEKAKQTVTVTNSDSSPKPRIPTIKITSYAWDQSDKLVKIYLSNLPGIKNIEESSIIVSSEGQLHSVTINNLNGKKYVFNVPKLAYSIDGITFKIKTDMLLLLLKKTEQKKWNVLTEQEKITKAEKEKSPARMDKDADPSASIMNMMKKMYDEGDDDMKRTIAKAWTESRDKQQIP